MLMVCAVNYVCLVVCLLESKHHVFDSNSQKARVAA